MAADLQTNDKPRFWVRQKAGATAAVDSCRSTAESPAPVQGALDVGPTRERTDSVNSMANVLYR